MFDKIIAYSVKNKFVIGLLMAALALWGIYSLTRLPVDAVPDITNNQVQIITISPTLATQEVEQFITTPVELALQNLQKVEEIRSISRFGLSVVTVVFEESYDLYLARQLVGERIREAQDNIPEDLGTPELAPISTGLGEIYQYVVRPEKGYEDEYDAMELRTIQDWIVKRQLSGVEGVAEINSMGGYLKQYEVAVDPSLLKSMHISIVEIYEALTNSNENTGGAYIEKNSNAYYIRSEGVVKSLDDIRDIVVRDRGGIPVLIRDVAKVRFGKAPRYGALVRDGEEVVGGKVMMFKGANSAEVTERVKERVRKIQKSLPEGVIIEPYLVRDKLVKTAIGTVEKNLIEGGLIVVFILVLLLGNWRAGLIVASVIPFSMLFAVSMMNMLGISANLMSLGAIDFGLIVDGAVIIVESVVHRLQIKYAGQRLTPDQMDMEVIESSQKIRSSAAFGEIIILMVYIPILALVGIEGKMFRPMAQTVMLAITGALILSLTYVPMMSALFLKKRVTNKKTIADRIIAFFQRGYAPLLEASLRHKRWFVGTTVVLFLFSAFTFSKMGGEFIPTLEEGDLAMQHILPPGSSLSQSVKTAALIQDKLLHTFPEIEDVVANIGSAEIPTDPMPVEIADYVLVMKPKKEWTSAHSRHEMFEKIEEALEDIPGVGYEFSQPIQMRFNELMTGTKADIAIKLYGEDLDLLYSKAKEAEKVLKGIDGIGTVNVEQTVGMPQIIISYDYNKMAQYGLHIREVNQVVRTAFAGEKAGMVYEGDKRFDLVIRMDAAHRAGQEDVEHLFVPLADGTQIPLRQVAKVQLIDAPMQISRENTHRRIVIGVNVGDVDVETLVERVERTLDQRIQLPPGYYFTYGGQFENLKAANARLMVAVPLALALIFILLYFTFGSFMQALLIFSAIPLSAIGGIWALELRGMPFSISAGIGFIALFGVAVLNGIVLIGYFNQLIKEGMTDILQRIRKGTKVRLRPVIMTAAVASLGFLPMALSTSGGAEVQRPLATVVIGGLISATFLTLVILPVFYYWLERWMEERRKRQSSTHRTALLILLMVVGGVSIKAQKAVSLEEAIERALAHHPAIAAARLDVERSRSLERMQYAPGNTRIEYQAEGLPDKTFGEQLHQIGISQFFPAPAMVESTNRLQEALTKDRRYTGQITANMLKRQVRIQYNRASYYRALKALYSGWVETYDNYLRIANARVIAGDASRMEALALESKVQDYTLLLKQAEANATTSREALQLLIGSTGEVIVADSLQQVVFHPDSGRLNNVLLERYRQKTAIESARVEVLKSRLKPGFELGYKVQKFSEAGLLNGVQAGISMPLFNRTAKKKIKAQELQVEVSKLEYQSKELAWHKEVLTTLNRINLLDAGVHFYSEQLQKLNPEMIRIARINYEAGELSYLELLNTLQVMSSNHLKYLQQIKSYNDAVASYQYLTNQ